MIQTDPIIFDIMDFWFGHDPLKNLKKWFIKDADFDQIIRENYQIIVELALEGKLEEWRETSLSSLGYILVTDQFTRNVFRGESRAFSGDAIALKATLDGIAKEYDKNLECVERWFYYMPLMHSEDIEIQNHSVALFEEISFTCSVEYKTALSSAHQYAIQHAEIIKRFGRFPHRNQIIGRQSSAEELEFLKSPGSSF